jgi:DNA-binding LacI/PurR family transcriptional regulator
MVTITDISKVFGVSSMTVSNALNSRGGVSIEKAGAIREYARKLGYRPAYMAKSLLKGRTDMVGLCLRASPEDPWMAGILHRIQDRLREQGLHLNLGIADGGVERELWTLNFFREFRVDAVIVGPLGFLEEYNALTELLTHQPYVLAFDAIEGLPIDHLKIDAYTGGGMAVDYLVGQGHRKIGFLGLNQIDAKFPSLRTRYTGFGDGLRRHGLESREEWTVRIGNVYDLIDGPLTQLLESGRPLPTAFLCHNDVHAARAVKILANRGLRVPEDFSLVGFDNQPIAELILPGITSIGYDVDQYAGRIVEMVTAGIQEKQKDASRNQARPIRRYEEPPKLIERGSVRKI